MRLLIASVFVAASPVAAVAVSAVSVDDAGARVVHCPLGAPAGVTAAAFSPDGRRLAYARPDSTGAYAIVVSTLDGRVVARRAEGIAAPNGMAWAPRGSRLAYTSGSELHVVDAADRLALRASAPLELGGWLPDGSGIAVAAGALPVAESYLVDASSDAVRDLGPGAHAVPSPDGTRVALVVVRPSPTIGYPGQSQQIQVLDLASEQRTTLFPADALVPERAWPVSELTWSPDSRQIAFLWDIDVLPDLMAQNADGSSTGLFGREHGALPTQVGMIPPIRWTRRGIIGNALLEDGGSAVAFYDVVSGRARYRGLTGFGASIAAVSRDGAEVAYVATAPNALPGAGGLRLVAWPGRKDHALLPCRGTDGADRIEASAEPSTILALGGNDVVEARNGRRDEIDCGRGVDVARLDRGDAARRCERVRR